MIAPSVEEGLSFEEASYKSAKRFDKKLTQTEKAAFYRFTTLLKKSESAGENADESKKIADLEADFLAEIEKSKRELKSLKDKERIRLLEAKLAQAESRIKQAEGQMQQLSERVWSSTADKVLKIYF